MSEIREHSPFPQRTDLEDFGGPTFLSDDFQEGALESSIPDIEIVSFFPVLYDFCNNSKSQESTRPDIEIVSFSPHLIQFLWFM
jgi:hypothetical protein